MYKHVYYKYTYVYLMCIYKYIPALLCTHVHIQVISDT